LQPVG